MSLRHISECLPRLDFPPLTAGMQGRLVAEQARHATDAVFLAAARKTMTDLGTNWERRGYSVVQVRTFLNEFIEAAASRRTELAREKHMAAMGIEA